MEQSIQDLAVDILKERLRGAQALMKERYKKTRPFRKEPIPEREQLYLYETRGYETFSQIANEQGLSEAVKWKNKMEQLKGGL